MEIDDGVRWVETRGGSPLSARSHSDTQHSSGSRNSTASQDEPSIIDLTADEDLAVALQAHELEALDAASASTASRSRLQPLAAVSEPDVVLYSPSIISMDSPSSLTPGGSAAAAYGLGGRGFSPVCSPRFAHPGLAGRSAAAAAATPLTRPMPHHQHQQRRRRTASAQPALYSGAYPVEEDPDVVLVEDESPRRGEETAAAAEQRRQKEEQERHDAALAWRLHMEEQQARQATMYQPPMMVETDVAAVDYNPPSVFTAAATAAASFPDDGGAGFLEPTLQRDRDRRFYARPPPAHHRGHRRARGHSAGYSVDNVTADSASQDPAFGSEGVFEADRQSPYAAAAASAAPGTLAAAAASRSFDSPASSAAPVWRPGTFASYSPVRPGGHRAWRGRGPAYSGGGGYSARQGGFQGHFRGASDVGESYEELLALDDTIRKPGLSKGLLDAASTLQTLTEADVARFDRCVICQDDYAVGDTVRRLPCLCVYHKDCIEKYFEHSTLCPICRKDVREAMHG